MWIERLDIEGFGRLAGPYTFEPGLTLITGLNEAGKSTLREALVRAMFGYSSRERRRFRGDDVAPKDEFKPWLHSHFGLVATMREVDGRSLRVAWDFAEHTVEVRDADTGEDLSPAVRRAHADVELGPYLLGMEFDDYCQVCCLDQTTLEAVKRSDSLVNALQEAVESIGSDVRVADADERLAGFLSTHLGVHSGHYGALRGKIYMQTLERQEQLVEALEQCELARDEIAGLTHELTLTERQVSIFGDQVDVQRQRLLRARSLELEHSLAEAEQLQRAAGDQPPADAVLPEGRVRRVRAALERLNATDEAIAALERRAGEAGPELARLRKQERDIQGRADGLAAYADVDASAEADVRALLGRLRGAEEELVEQPASVPARDPSLAAYRERRAEFLASVGQTTVGYRSGLLGAALALAFASLVAGIAVHPAAFVGVLGAAILVVVAGRSHTRSSEDFSPELEQRAVAEDRAVAAAEAAIQEARQRAEERSRRIAQTSARLQTTLEEAGCPPAPDLDQRTLAYLTACDHHRVVHDLQAQLARVEAQIADRATAERELRNRTAERSEVEAELRNALQACSIDERDLTAARSTFATAERASAEAAKKSEQAARAAAALEALLGQRQIDELREAAHAAERALREHTAPHGELTTDAGDPATATRDLENLEARLRDARIHQATLKATVEERERGLAQPAELKVELAACKDRIVQIELARDAVRLARETLAEAARDAHRAFAPFLNRALERNLPRITDGRYREVAVDDELNMTLVAPETQKQVPAHALSRGTQDQIFLVQRLELARMLDPTLGAAPLLLDDPFARSDPERLRLGIELLAEMAAHRQIVLFSEDPQLALIAREACHTCGVIELPAPPERAAVSAEPEAVA